MQRLLKSEGLSKEFLLDSAGTHAYHVNEAPDPRAQEAALARDVDISGLRARAVEISDFRNFDYVIAMDKDNLKLLEQIRPANSRAQLGLMLSFGGDENGEVPDPYYGGTDGFEQVLDMLEQASRGLLAAIRQQ
jgi:protein-tyrosine phosphatase